ncbi:MAG: hypothetical protein R3F39_24280 [Myxococcota bacterium]
MNRIRRGLLVLLASAAAAAACADAEEPACLAGARICFGSIVRLCDPVTQSFVDERVCPTTSRCMSGECVALVFDNDAGPRDAEVTLPDADPGADVATDAAPDADVLPDAIPDADVLPDAIPDAVFDADADAALDGAPDALPDADGGPEIQPDTTPDTDAEVAAPPDADGGPEIQPDTTPDADVEVEVTPDAVAVPDTVPDAAPDTAPDADAIIAPPVPFSPSTHHMQYDRVANIVLLDDLQRVAFHPAGGFAALVGTGGKLAHYAADAEAITPGAVLGGTVHDLAADPAGAYFLAVGVDKSGNGVLHRIATDGALLGDVTSTPLTQGEGVAVVASPDGARFAIGTSKKSGGLYLNTILIWRDGLGVVSSKSYTDSGLSDLMWASPALHAGSDAIITGDGTNGAASRT